jgi:hypothetical protein
MESIVDAAHIHEFRDSRNNDPRNGMALSKNAHWQFDRGLWSLNNDYRVVVNKVGFAEDGMESYCLMDFVGRKIFLPSDSTYWPDYSYLDRHRKRHGFPNPINTLGINECLNEKCRFWSKTRPQEFFYRRRSGATSRIEKFRERRI